MRVGALCIAQQTPAAQPERTAWEPPLLTPAREKSLYVLHNNFMREILLP